MNRTGENGAGDSPKTRGKEIRMQETTRVKEQHFPEDSWCEESNSDDCRSDMIFVWGAVTDQDLSMQQARKRKGMLPGYQRFV